VIEPTNVDIGDWLTVSDKDSRYNGEQGRVLAIYEDHLILEIPEENGWSITLDFDLGQLSRA